MLKVANSVISASRITGTLPVANGGTGVTTSTGTGNTVLSATPTLSGDVTLSTGNLVIGTSGKGIDFSITSSGSGTMTSELLADYEEGTWSPSVTATTPGVTPPTIASATGTYTKIGRQVYVTYDIQISVNGTGAGAIRLDGLPFTLLVRGFGAGVESDVVGFNTITNGIAATTFALVSQTNNAYPGGNAYHLQGDLNCIV